MNLTLPNNHSLTNLDCTSGKTVLVPRVLITPAIDPVQSIVQWVCMHNTCFQKHANVINDELSME